MHISIHVGAHVTDNDQIIKSLLKSSGDLTQQGIAVPGPSRYRGLLAGVLGKLRGEKADTDTQNMLIESLVDSPDIERLVIGHQNLLGAPHRSLEHNQLYHLAHRNTEWLKNLFSNHEITFFLAIRNPATFIPALMGRLSEIERSQILAELDPYVLAWSDTLHAIHEVMPDTPITVWCNEDTPLLWPSIMRQMCGGGGELNFAGAMDNLSEIMTPEGLKHLQDYVKQTKIPSDIQMRRVIAAFLEKYAIPEALVEEIDMPGWDQKLVDELTQTYDDDLSEIEAIPNITLLQP